MTRATPTPSCPGAGVHTVLYVHTLTKHLSDTKYILQYSKKNCKHHVSDLHISMTIIFFIHYGCYVIYIPLSISGKYTCSQVVYWKYHWKYSIAGSGQFSTLCTNVIFTTHKQCRISRQTHIANESFCHKENTWCVQGYASCDVTNIRYN